MTRTTFPLAVFVLFLLPGRRAVVSASSCTDDLGCSLNGFCLQGACVCDRGWQGPTCAGLAQGLSYRVWPPQGTAGQDQTCLAASWGAGLVPPVPGVSKKWDLFVDSICVGPFPLQCSHTDLAQVGPLLAIQHIQNPKMQQACMPPVTP